MQPLQQGQGHGRSLRLAGVLLALLVLLAVVSFASRTGFGRASDAAPTPGYVSWAMSVFLVLFVLMIPFAVYSYLLQLREFGQKRAQKSFQARVIRSLLVMFVLFALGGLAIWFRSHHGTLLFNQSLVHGIGGRQHSAPHGAQTYKPTFQYPVLWGALALGAVGILWAWWAWRRKSQLEPLEPLEPTVAEEVAASIGDVIDDLETETDARRAVIAAYARMEGVFARRGVERRASETPVEYLRRILLELTSRTEAVRRLTALFEQAKFSDHPIDDAMKQDAISALRTIRDDLQAAPA